MVPDDKIDKLQIVKQLRSEKHVSGTVDSFNITADSIQIDFRGPSRKASVEITRADGTTAIHLYAKGLVGLLDDLHRADSTGPVWDFVIDLVSITLCLASITGLIPWTQLSKRRTIGLICLLGGAAIILGIYFTSVP